MALVYIPFEKEYPTTVYCDESLIGDERPSVKKDQPLCKSSPENGKVAYTMHICPAYNTDLRSVISIFCIVLVLLQSQTKLWIYLTYTANKDFITSSLCENIARPEMKCEGKCYLGIQLEKDENAKEKPGNTRIKSEFSPWVCPTKPVTVFYIPPQFFTRPIVFEKPILSGGFIACVFIPPETRLIS